MGKQKPPGGRPLGDFCFPKGKQKPLGGILAYNNLTENLWNVQFEP